MNFTSLILVSLVGMSFGINVNKKILFLLAVNIVCLCALWIILGEHSAIGNEGENKKAFESEIMVGEYSEKVEIYSENENEIITKIEELKKEKEELARLKKKLQEISERDGQSEGNKLGNKEPLNSEKSNNSLSAKEENRPVESNVIENQEIEKKEDKVLINKIEEIVNPFEIAETLYKMGGYEKAIDIYNLINKKDVEFEKAAWITYQTANCYRKLGMLEKALKIYKEIQEEYEGTYWGQQAQWYIDEIKWREGEKDKLEVVVER